MTVNKLIEEVKTLAQAGQGVDYDGSWGTQCVDLINYYLYKYYGIALGGNAIDLLNSAKKQGLVVHYMPTEANPKKGAVFVTRESTHRFGHTGWVIEDSDGWTMNTVEQNIDGNANALEVGGPARFVKGRGFGNVVGWFYPPTKTVTQASGFLKNEKGTMTVTVNVLNVRNSPDLNGPIVATYKKGARINYDSVYTGAGFIWISYQDAKGNRRYVAAGIEKNGKNVNKYGIFQ